MGCGANCTVAEAPSGPRKRTCTLAFVTGLYSLSRTSTRIGPRALSANTALGAGATTYPDPTATKQRSGCCQNAGWVLPAWSVHLSQRQHPPVANKAVRPCPNFSVTSSGEGRWPGGATFSSVVAPGFGSPTSWEDRKTVV